MCRTDSDCATPGFECIQRGESRRCSKTCNANDECADSLLCAVTGPELGICVAPGPGAAGSACETNADCASWFCAQGQCLSSCDTTGCQAGFRCLQLHTQSVCTPIGEAVEGASCRRSDQCASGICRGGVCTRSCPDGQCPNDRVCIRNQSLNLCERRCATSSDCPPDAVCLNSGSHRLCTTRGTQPTDARCDRHSECADGRCENRRCAQPCPERGNCPDGLSCLETITGAFCRAAGPTPAGGRCDSAGVCESAFCAAGVCSQDCAGDGVCPEDYRCARFAEGDFCFPRCRSDQDCAASAFCDLSLNGGPICYWLGATEDGDACTRHRDCRSGYCDGRLCRTACESDNECVGDHRCVNVGPRNICTGLPLPINAACERTDACADPLRCTAGRCLPACEDRCPPGTTCYANACHPLCEGASECRPGRICNAVDGPRPMCVDRGRINAGEICDSSAVCRDGLCADGRCRVRCGRCQDGQRCWPDDDGWCLDVGALEAGSICENHGDCRTGLCAGRRCSTPCDAEGECLHGMSCGDYWGQRLCHGTCNREDAACPEGEYCAVRDVTVPSCRVAESEPTLGRTCETEQDCGRDSIGCVEGVDGMKCRAPCGLETSGACPTPASCIEFPRSTTLGACVPTGTLAPLERCAQAHECLSGRCLTNYLDGRCLSGCETDVDCATGHCVDLARDPLNPIMACALACNPAANECEPPLECRRRSDGAHACY